MTNIEERPTPATRRLARHVMPVVVVQLARPRAIQLRFRNLDEVHDLCEIGDVVRQ